MFENEIKILARQTEAERLYCYKTSPTNITQKHAVVTKQNKTKQNRTKQTKKCTNPAAPNEGKGVKLPNKIT